MDPRERNRTLILGAITLILSALFFLKTGNKTGFNRAYPFRVLEDSIQDKMSVAGRKSAIDPDMFEYIGIDEVSYEGRFFQVQEKNQETPDQMTRDDYIMLNVAEKTMGQWSRSVWAEFADRIMSAGARCLVIDIRFGIDPERLRGDTNLAEVIQKYAPNIIIGSEFLNSEANMKVSGPPLSVIPDPFLDTSQNESVGLINIFPEDDGKVRRGVYQFSDHDRYRALWDDQEADPNPADTLGDLGKDVVYPSLSARAAKVMGYESNLPPVSARPLIRFSGGPGVFVMNSIAHILDPDVYRTKWKENGRLKDKLVLVGPHNSLFQDKHDTPFGSMPGPEYHMHMINAAIQGEFIDETSEETDQLIVLCTGFLVILLTLLMKKYFVRFFLGLALSVGFLWFVWWQYNDQNFLIGSIGVPLVLLNTSNVITLAIQSIWTYADKREFEGTMGKYFSPAVMEEVMNNPGSLDAKSATVTLLLTDLRNSTPLAERLGPGGMFKLLNQIFEAQTDAIMDNEGQLEHFLGDQFLSYWGAPYDQPDGPNQSLQAARELIKGMEKVKEIQEPEVKAIFGYGVALHCGFALVGNKGSEKKMEYGLVGDTINEAARIEALTKYYGAQLLVSQEIFTQLTQPGRHRLIDRVIVKGKSEPVVLYELEQSKSPDNFDAIIASFNSGFADYSDGKFEEAKAKFQKLIDEHDDGPSKAMLSRCEHLIANPDPDWKGVWKMESK